MRIHKFIRNAAVIASGSLLLACASGPRALEQTMPERSLTSVTPSERGPVLDALRDQQIALMELDNATYRLEEIEADVDVARNEHDKTELDKESATTREDTAEKSRDTNRIATASEGRTRAESSHESATRKIDYLEAERKHLERVVQWRRYDVRAKSAAVELAKASIARDKNLPLRGFDYATYERQYRAAVVEADEYKRMADRAGEQARTMRAHWQAMATQERATTD